MISILDLVLSLQTLIAVKSKGFPELKDTTIKINIQEKNTA